MTDRITYKMLQGLCDYLNKLTNSPATSYAQGEDGKYHAQIGNYHISGAYGGVNLERICNDGGAITQPIGGGFKTKRELYNLITAYIRGIEAQKQS